MRSLIWQLLDFRLTSGWGVLQAAKEAPLPLLSSRHHWSSSTVVRAEHRYRPR